MELEVGMLFRTRDGYFTKIKSFFIRNEVLDEYEFTLENCEYGEKYWLDEVKASHNIIDLIEPKDLLEYEDGNTIKILDIDYNLTPRYFLINSDGTTNWENEEWFKDGLFSILTHEQYEQNCYKVGK